MIAQLGERIPLILERVDLLELVTSIAGPPVRVSGDLATFRCPNPDHQDHTPSFQVKDRHWICRSQCATRGDAIDLLTWLRLVPTKAAAIEFLAQRVGLGRLPAGVFAPPGLSTDQKAAILGPFLRERGWPVSVADTLDLTVILDYFGRPRVRFPFRLHGQVVRFQDRAVDSTVTPRWMSSPGPIKCLYEADRLVLASEQSSVVLVEGISDTATMVAAFPGAAIVGIPGTAAFKERWAPAFAGLTVLVVADNDEAGRHLRSDLAHRFDGTATVYQVHVPAEYGDINEWALACADLDRFADEFDAACDAAADRR